LNTLKQKYLRDLKNQRHNNGEHTIGNPFIDLVDKILAITKDDDYLNDSSKQTKVKEDEHQIDQMVYQLYGLTDDEIKVVEGGEDK